MQLQINLHGDQGTTPWRSRALMHYEATPLFALANAPIGDSGQEPIFSSGDIDEGDLAFWAAPTHIYWGFTGSWIIKCSKLLRDSLTRVLLFFSLLMFLITGSVLPVIWIFFCKSSFAPCLVSWVYYKCLTHTVFVLISDSCWVEGMEQNAIRRMHFIFVCVGHISFQFFFTVHLFLFMRECFNCILLKNGCLPEYVGKLVRLLPKKMLWIQDHFECYSWGNASVLENNEEETESLYAAELTCICLKCACVALKQLPSWKRLKHLSSFKELGQFFSVIWLSLLTAAACVCAQLCACVCVVEHFSPNTNKHALIHIYLY